MAIVYKYDLNETGETHNEFPVLEAKLPYLAKILRIGFQHGKARIWAMVDEEAIPADTRRYLVLGTGIKIPDIVGVNLVYRETADTGPYVFHFFEMIDNTAKY